MQNIRRKVLNTFACFALEIKDSRALSQLGPRGAVYPKGSEEGHTPEGAGDPLGYIPKSLRDKLNVINTVCDHARPPA